MNSNWIRSTTAIEMVFLTTGRIHDHATIRLSGVVRSLRDWYQERELLQAAIGLATPFDDLCRLYGVRVASEES